jgi:hypothetical protein
MHAVANSLEELLAPISLSRLVGTNVDGVTLAPFSTVDGRSGGDIQSVTAHGPDGESHRFVLKRTSWDTDIIMRMTNDRTARAVVIWQRELLDRAPPEVSHGVLACCRDGDGWAMLLEDFRGHMLPADEQRLSQNENTVVLDALAAMHTTFWEADETSAEEYALCDFKVRYKGFFPGAFDSGVDQDLPIVGFIREGWGVFPEVVDSEVADIVAALHHDVTPLCQALSRYPRTVVHGDFHHGNLGILPVSPPRLIVLDWSSVSLGPPAADLGEYQMIGVMRLPGSKDETIALYRHLLSQRLGNRFDETWWAPQLDLGLLGEFLRLGWDKSRTAAYAPTPELRERERHEIAWWSDRVRRAVVHL